MKAAQHGLGDSSMLERIDALFACGAGEHINIPQIVVVGDQSSGKSSVLSGLIRKDLPRDSGLCTRFATKIVFRRAKERGIRASIIPDEDAGVEHRSAIAAWGELSVDSFDDFTFADIMKEVHNVIGIASPNDVTSGTERKPTFSGDVLQLEISGPDEEHLSVIDVPGIFRDSTPGLTTKADIQLVRSMVTRYMENPRSVMLTVVPANVDVATQEILHMANELDPEGDRTLDFFRTKRPWSDLNHENVGIEALRNRLKDVLSGLIRREFTNVRIRLLMMPDSGG
ncbi:hypothetical protein CBER1_11907 [Cercospora berteroae]|uniref:Dynamin GTPase domain-containing protein n=1 Tax=Cercospora berteroae TaxID=357750 RepID=A0A2S6CNN2_9PEZI|nr:hypothetical protein CBER1_11907 [Cercospora berteroae]